MGERVTIEPTVIVIFGITGDLFRRKLLPALLDLRYKGFLPAETRIVGFSRREFSAAAFADFVREASQGRASGIPPNFLEKFSYCEGQYDDQASYQKLGEHLRGIEQAFVGPTNRLFYLAVPPHLYGTIFENLSHSGLARPDAVKGWERILVEKPFGRDLSTAKKLDELLGKLFKEDQIFRIDHYLAKEAVQNIVMFRFSNALFEPIWNREYVERVEVRLFEAGGVNGRAAFFDGVGALRDVGQNHLLQMLSVVAMEPPPAYSADHIRAARGALLAKVHAKGGGVRGQYEGYRTESGVAPDSDTETYVRIEAEVRNKRWRGVVFVLEAGKVLGENKSEIVVRFKRPESCFAHKEGERCDHTNTLTFRIQPNEGIALTFWVTKPGLTNELESKELSFAYGLPPAGRLSDAHERLLYDALVGDQTLFASTKEIRAAWKFVASIFRNWKQNKTPLLTYPKGSNGPV